MKVPYLIRPCPLNYLYVVLALTLALTTVVIPGQMASNEYRTTPNTGHYRHEYRTPYVVHVQHPRTGCGRPGYLYRGSFHIDFVSHSIPAAGCIWCAVYTLLA